MWNFPTARCHIYNALKVSNPAISDQQGNLIWKSRSTWVKNTVRCVAMDTTEGLVRGMDAMDTGAGITVPVGTETLGRVLNVIGEPVDEQGQSTRKNPIRFTARRRNSSTKKTKVQAFETGIKVVDFSSRLPAAERSACSAAPESARPLFSWN